MEEIISKQKYHYLGFENLNYFQEKENNIYKKMCLEIKNDYESLDKSLRESAMRKKKGYIVKGYVPRKIITVFGEITFTRTKYQYFDAERKKYKTICLIDNYLQIEPYQRMNLHLRLEIMKELGTGKRQRDIVDQFKFAGITRVSISNLARNIDTKDLNEASLYWDYQIPRQVEEKQYIYINVDDTFTSLRENKVKSEYRIRLAVAHLGYVNTYDKRKELLQKRVFYNITKVPLAKNTSATTEYAETLYQQLTRFYGDISNKKIIVCGDGASWIQELAHYLAADYVLDKFHLFSLFYKVFPHRSKSKKILKSGQKQTINEFQKEIYGCCCDFVNQGNVTSLIFYLKKLKESDLLIDKIKKINELITYITNHQNGISNYQKPYYIGSQTEAMVSHLIKSVKGYGAKLYNIKTFVNLLNLKFGHINQLKPIDIYCDQILETAAINKNFYAENVWLKHKVSDFLIDEPLIKAEVPGIEQIKNLNVKSLLSRLVH